MRSNTMKILGSAVLVAGAAGVAGLGTFGAFTSTTGANQDVDSSNVTIGITAGPQDIGVAVPANFLAGDTVHRSVTLSRVGQNFGSVSLTTASSVNSILTSDTVLGLQYTVDMCAVPWTKTGPVLSCTPGSTSVLVSRPAVSPVTALPPAVTSALNTTGSAYLRVAMTLPLAATDAFEDKSDTVSFTFDATQRAGSIV